MKINETFIKNGEIQRISLKVPKYEEMTRFIANPESDPFIFQYQGTSKEALKKAMEEDCK